MAQPFKKQIVRYVTSDGQRCPPDTPGAIKRNEESRNYYGVVPQPNGRRKSISLCPDLTRSKQLLNKLLTDAAMRRHGMTDPFEEHARRPLQAHLDDYRTELEARDNAPRYVSLVYSRLKALFEGCGFRSLADLSASRTMDWLAQQRRNEVTPQLPPGIDLFTRSEAATASA